MTTAPYAPTGYPLPVADTTAEKLASASVKVKVVFDIFAVLILIATALITLGLFIAAANEHQSYIDDYYNYTDDTASYVIAGFLAPVYGAWLWASTKFFSVIAGYVGWRTTK